MKKLIIFALFFAFVSSNALADDKEVFTQAYTIVSKHYIEPITAGDVALQSLKQLNISDNNITIADDDKRITVYKNATVVRSYRKPAATDIKSWVALTEKVIKEVKKLSLQVKERDFELVDVMLKGAISSLDAGSKYYYDISEEKEDKVRHFSSKHLKDDMLYVKIKDFSPGISQNFAGVIKPYHQAMILDLRGNKGGMLDEAIEVAKLFIDGGIIASARERSTKSNNFYVSTDGDIFAERPIFVLIDANTASSAEVLAAALKEQGRAQLIGTNTFGKGTIQTVYGLPNESYIALSTAYLYTPSGNKIDKNGIMPNVCTSDLIMVNDKNPCPPQDREKNSDDIDTALDLIKKSIDKH